MGKLSLIVLADEEFEKKLTGEQINEFKTVQDVLNFFDA
jgi:acyl carrier protein